MARAAILTLLALGAGASGAAAGELELDVVGARAIGRAGTQTVSGAGGAALLVNPAGLARRPEGRVQVGVALHDDDASYRTPDAEATDSPTVSDRGPTLAAPMLAAHLSVGPVVLGVALLELGRLDHTMPAPDNDQPPADVARLFPHRYGGLEISARRRALMAGAGARVGEWLGVGLSVGAADVEVAERRRVWAGFRSIDTLGLPDHDVDVALTARDRFVPLASGGVLVAPPQVPLEMGVAVSWSADAWADGDAVVGAVSTGAGPDGDGAGDADLRIGGPTTLRGGLRYLGQRIAVEAGGDMIWYRDAGKLPEWRTHDVAVRHEVSGATAPLGRLPSLLARRDHAILRGAVDVETVPGLLWLTAGYSFATAATSRAHLAPAFGDTGGHTVAAGAEASWNQITFTLGYARTIAPDVTVDADETAVSMENPFGAAAGTAPAAAGTHARAHDAVGLAIEIAWE